MLREIEPMTRHYPVPMLPDIPFSSDSDSENHHTPCLKYKSTTLDLSLEESEKAAFQSANVRNPGSRSFCTSKSTKILSTFNVDYYSKSSKQNNNYLTFGSKFNENVDISNSKKSSRLNRKRDSISKLPDPLLSEGGSDSERDLECKRRKYKSTALDLSLDDSIFEMTPNRNTGDRTNDLKSVANLNSFIVDYYSISFGQNIINLSLESKFNECIDRANPNQNNQSIISTFLFNDIVRHICSLQIDQFQRHFRPILRDLIQHPLNNEIFNVPVNPSVLNIPDYFSKIRHPMDFGTVKRKLSEGLYMSIQQLIGDINLVFNNAITYNSPSHGIHQIAKQMKSFFELQVNNLSEKLLKEVKMLYCF